MADIFVSYSSKDRERIGQLVDHLEGAGFSVWWDRELRGGSMFSKEIEAEILNANAVVVIWTESSVDSHWVADEAELALRSSKLVPIRLDDIEPPMGFRQVHTLDFSAWKGESNYTEIQTLVRALSHHARRNDQITDEPAREKSAAAPEASIAVLPFVNRSSDPEQEFFSDGISEELLNVLGKLNEVKVAARSSSFQFKETDKLVDEIASLLGVAHILEGGVRKSGNRVRVTAQLIKAATKFQLWSETYDRTLDDVFEIQDEISAAIVEALKGYLLTETEVPESNRAASVEAYEQYLMGQHLLNTRTKNDIENAIKHYERALENDPNFAQAYAGLSIAWMLLQETSLITTFGDLPIGEAVEKASPFAKRAIALDPQLAEAQMAMGFISFCQQDFDSAQKFWDRAVEINPSNALLHTWRGVLEFQTGNYEQEFESKKRAAELDPLSTISLFNHASSLFTRGRFGDSEAVIERIKGLDSISYHYIKSWQAWQRGRPADALTFLLMIEDEFSGDRRAAAGLNNMFGLLGFPDESLRYAHGSTVLKLNSYQWNERWKQFFATSERRLADAPDNSQATMTMGQAFLISGDVVSASSLLEKVSDGFDDGIGPGEETNAITALVRKAMGDADGCEKIHQALRNRLDNVLSGGLDNLTVKLLKFTCSVLENNDSSALAALESISRGSGLAPRFTMSLRAATQLSQEPYFEKILGRQAAKFAEERDKTLGYICDQSNFNTWKPLPGTCLP